MQLSDLFLCNIFTYTFKKQIINTISYCFHFYHKPLLRPIIFCYNIRRDYLPTFIHQVSNEAEIQDNFCLSPLLATSSSPHLPPCPLPNPALPPHTTPCLLAPRQEKKTAQIFFLTHQNVSIMALMLAGCVARQFPAPMHTCLPRLFQRGLLFFNASTSSSGHLHS